MAELPMLLFFDTFLHSDCESSDEKYIATGYRTSLANQAEVNLDLVQFQRPVYITEIRVIPLGGTVFGYFAEKRLGATNPSEFPIEFFVNDLNNTEAGNFKTIGSIDYHYSRGPIDLRSKDKIPTDGLILRGKYKTVTLAVYGHVVAKAKPKPIREDVSKKQSINIVPSSRAISENKTLQWIEKHAEVYNKEPAYDITEFPYDNEGSSYDYERSEDLKSESGTEERRKTSVHVDEQRDANRKRSIDNLKIEERKLSSERRSSYSQHEREKDRRNRYSEKELHCKYSDSKRSEDDTKRTDKEVSSKHFDNRRLEDDSKRQKVDSDSFTKSDSHSKSSSPKSQTKYSASVIESQRSSYSVKVRSDEDIKSNQRSRSPKLEERADVRNSSKEDSRRSSELMTSGVTSCRLIGSQVSNSEAVKLNDRYSPKAVRLSDSQLKDRDLAKQTESVKSKLKSGDDDKSRCNEVKSVCRKDELKDASKRADSVVNDRIKSDLVTSSPSRSTSVSLAEARDVTKSANADVKLAEHLKSTKSSKRVLRSPWSSDRSSAKSSDGESGVELHSRNRRDRHRASESRVAKGALSSASSNVENVSGELARKKNEIADETTAVSAPLAPNDVEMISEEEILPESPAIDKSSVDAVDANADEPALVMHEDSISMDFEPILSESSDIDSDIVDAKNTHIDLEDDADEPYKIFNPYVYEIRPLSCLKDPCLTDNEWKQMQLKASGKPVDSNITEKVQKLLESCSKNSFDENSEEWVVNAENMIEELKNSFFNIDEEIIDHMTKVVTVGLDFDRAFNQPKPTMVIRHLKAGISLTETICALGEETNAALISRVNVQHQLLNLYDRKHMALSLKLAILKALDTTLNYGSGVRSFVTKQTNEVKDEDGENGYQRLLSAFTSAKATRLRYAFANLLRKIHAFELLENVRAGGDESTTVLMLEEVRRYIRDARYLLSQPPRFLPIRPRFEYPPMEDAQFCVFSYSKHFDLIDTLSRMMGNLRYGRSAASAAVLSVIVDIVTELCSSECGLLFLASNAQSSNRLLKVCLDTRCTAQTGLYMAHRMYVINLVDQFSHAWQMDSITDVDNVKLLDVLTALFYLTFTATGKHSVCGVLCKGNMSKPFLTALLSSRKTSRERRKSPGREYLIDLLWMVVKNCAETVDFLRCHAEDLLQVADLHAVSSDVSWLNPLKLNVDDVSGLCDIVKKNVDKTLSYPGELITAIRLLRLAAISPVSGKPANDEMYELKYKATLIQIYSHNGFTYLASILNKVCAHYQRPYLHTFALIGNQCTVLLMLLLPCLQLIKEMLSYVIRCRKSSYKDYTIVGTVLKLNNLLFTISLMNNPPLEVALASREIVDILLAYTQFEGMELSEDSCMVEKSMWTIMLSEVLKFAIFIPEVFMSTLTVFSELLPLPLPIQSNSPLTDEEVALALNSRKLWSVHLLPLESVLVEMIGTVITSSYQPLLQLLKRICLQLADISASMASIVVRTILQILQPELSEVCTSKCDRLLNFLACLVSHAPIKIGLLYLTGWKEYNPNFWNALCKILLQPNDSIYHLHGQEHVLSIVQSVCDIGISLLPSPNGESVSIERYFGNSTPPKSILEPLCNAMLQHLGMDRTSLPSMSTVLRTCITLTEYDFGLNLLKLSLFSNSDVLLNILNKLVREWSQENTECINCLSLLLDLFKEFSLKNNEKAKPRSVHLNYEEYSNLLKWSTVDGKKHPLYELDAFLADNEDDVLQQSLHQNLLSFISFLNEEKCTDTSMSNEPVLLEADSLVMQFSSRLVYVLGDVQDQRLSVRFCLSNPIMDDVEQNPEMVSCDLEEVATTYLPTLKLQHELEKLCHRDDEKNEETEKELVSNELDGSERKEIVQTALSVKLPKSSRSYSRPIPYRNDPFRSRIPNSSRAPSLHVDDFIALEKQHNEQAVGYSRSKHAMTEQSVNRGRSLVPDRLYHSQYRQTSMLNAWPQQLLPSSQISRSQNQSTALRHASPLLMRSSTAELMRYSMAAALRWPPVRSSSLMQMRRRQAQASKRMRTSPQY